MRYWKMGLVVALTLAGLTFGGAGVAAATDTGAGVGTTVAELVVVADGPSQPGKPTQPDKPGQPGKPSRPTTPSKPGKRPSRVTPLDRLPGTGPTGGTATHVAGKPQRFLPQTGEAVAFVVAGVGSGLLGLIGLCGLLLLRRRREEAADEAFN
ncbi:LPXTG cell wall anchor domain-containing protein [Lacticaseibacillus parakribbianus]|uniref:LPXTG cell wall anchor domain-containing protein n=1 Tax=Lacticaseibacillus parakribbianus TaxID=2970927 RepID=UPI0021CB89FC|nr:LPXTG cell wall anchor domain-containing protein [Lacticaseibacillus parakribbianus]